MNFETSVKRLDEIIARLEDNSVSLEEAIEMYKEGAELLLNCKKQLEQAEMLVTVAEASEED